MPPFDLPDIPLESYTAYVADRFKQLTQPVINAFGTQRDPAIQAVYDQVKPENRLYVDQAVGAAQRAGVNPVLYTKQIFQESGFNPSAGSNEGAKGIAQFTDQTAKGFGIDPYNPSQALDAGARYMASSLAQNGGDYRLALAAYNAGQGNVNKYGQNIFNPSYLRSQGWSEQDANQPAQYIRSILGESNGPAANSQATTAPLAAPLPRDSYLAQPAASASQAPLSFKSFSDGLLHQFSQRLGMGADVGQEGDGAGSAPSQLGGRAAGSSGATGVPNESGTSSLSLPQLPDGQSFTDWSNGLIQHFGQAVSFSPTPAPSSPSGYNDMAGASSSFAAPPAASSPPGGQQGDINRTVPGQSGQEIGQNRTNAAPSFADWSTGLINQFGRTVGLSGGQSASSEAPGASGGTSGPSYNDMVGANSSPPSSPASAGDNGGGIVGTARGAAESVLRELPRARQLVDLGLPNPSGPSGSPGQKLDYYLSKTDPKLPFNVRFGQAMDLAQADQDKTFATGAQMDPTGGVATGLAQTATHLMDPTQLVAPELGAPATAGLGAGVAGGLAYSRATGASPAETAANMETGGTLMMGAGLIGHALAPAVPRVAQAAGQALRVPYDLGVRPGLSVADVNGDVTRMYHGTGSAFQTPDGAKMDPNGLFGPGYYLTSDPRVASSYAETRATKPTQGFAKGASQQAFSSEKLQQLEEAVQYFQERSVDPLESSENRQLALAELASSKKDLAAEQVKQATGPNVRAVNVPTGLNLLNADKPIGQSTLKQIQAIAKDQGVTSLGYPFYSVSAKSTGESLHGALQSAIGQDFKMSTADANAQVNQILQRAGYDGITYNGGKRVPLMDEAGQPIQHQATVIFPESLPKIRNAISGTTMGSPPTIGGGILGAAYGATQGNTPEERAKNALAYGVGGALGVHVLGGGHLPVGMSIADVGPRQTISEALTAARTGWQKVSQIAKDLGVDVSSHETFLPMEIETMGHAPGTAPAALRETELYNQYTASVVDDALKQIRPQIEQLSTAVAGKKEAAYPELTRLAKGLTTDNGMLRELVPLKQWQSLTGDTRTLASNALVKQRGTVYVRPEYALDDIYQGDEAALKFGKSFDNLGDFQKAMYQARTGATGTQGQISQLKDLTAKEQELQAAYHAALPEAHLHDDLTAGAPTTPPATVPNAAFKSPPTANGTQPSLPGPSVAGQIPTTENPNVRAGNVLLNKYVSRDVQQVIADAAAKDPTAMEAARRGVIPDATVQQLADAVGVKVQKIVDRWKPGDAQNAETLVAMRTALSTKSDEVAALAKTAQSGNPADLLKLQVALKEQQAIQEAVSGTTAEAGRALRSFRATVASAVQSGNISQMQQILERQGGVQWTQDLAQKLSQLSFTDASPAARYQFLRDAIKPSLKDYLTELYYNALLSGPHTFAVKTTSETLSLALSPIERIASAAVEGPLAAAQGRAPQRFMGEAPADVVGMVGGIREGIDKFLYTMQHGFTQADVLNNDYIRRQAFKGTTGAVINFPSNILKAGVEMFGHIAESGALNAGAYRIARGEGATGQALADRMAELRQNPTPNLMKYATDTAMYRVYQKPPDDFTKALLAVRNVEPKGIPVGRILVPFLQTPVNLLKFGIERSPLGAFNVAFNADKIAAKNPEASDVIGRWLVGSGIGAAIALEVGAGNITGLAPSTPAERDAWEREGKTPLSMKVGDKWVSYGRLEPIAQTITQVASIVKAAQSGKDVQNAVADVAITIAAGFASQPYMQSLSTFMAAIKDPTRAAGLFTQGLASSAVPAAVRVAAQVQDPTMRQTNTPLQAMQANVPGLSQQLPARLTAFGEDRQRAGVSPILTNVLPVGISQATTDPINQELTKYGIEPGFSGKTLRGMNLTPQEQTDHQRVSGQLIRTALDRLVADPRYKAFDDLHKAAALQHTITGAKDLAARQYVGSLIQSQGRDAVVKRIQDAKAARLPKAS